MGLKPFNSLKPEWQKLFIEAALKTAAFERKLIRDNEAKQIEELKNLAMDVGSVNKTVFIEAMAPVYEQFFQKYPGWKEIVEKIRASK